MFALAIIISRSGSWLAEDYQTKLSYAACHAWNGTTYSQMNLSCDEDVYTHLGLLVAIQQYVLEL